MNLDIIKKFLKLAFTDKMVIGYNKKGVYLCMIVRNGSWETFYIKDLKKERLLNLPKTIINLLLSKFDIQHKLALNLISQLDPNKKYK